MAAPERLPEPALWHLLQLSDQFFPTGAYTYSHALETYVERGLIRDRTTCQALFVNLAWNALGPCDLVFCANAFERAGGQDLDGLLHLDRLLNAWKIPRELRDESRYTGHAFLRTATGLRPFPLCEAYFAHVREETTPGHHAIAFGLVARCLKIGRQQALLGYLYNICAGWVATAVRLVPLGQTDGQRMLDHLAPLCLDLIEQYHQYAPEEAWTCTPGLDLRSMQHERLYSRLCRS